MQNTSHVLAIELYTAARALDLRLRLKPDAKLGKLTQVAFQRLREKVPYTAGDTWWGPEIEAVHRMVEAGEFRL